MTLIMYRDGVLSADRRITHGHDYDEPYSGLENVSKLFVSSDNRIAIACAGILSPICDLEAFHRRFLEVTDFAAVAECRPRVVPKAWFSMMLMQDKMPGTTLFDKDRTMYCFMRGRFYLLMTRPTENGPAKYLEADLDSPRFCGSGYAAAAVLIRSEQEFELPRFYRIVAAACEGVSPNFDSIDISTIEGFQCLART